MFSGTSLLETLLADRERRWRSGEQMTSEECLEKFPGVHQDIESSVSLIYQEYCLRAESGRKPTATEFLSRFPEHASRLRVQFQFRQAILQVARKSVKRTPKAKRSKPGRVGHYELQRVLNRGQTGTAYEAIDSRRATRVVVKLFDVGQEGRSEFVRELREKAQAAVRIRHPNLRRISGVGLWKGEPYLVADFVSGMSLAEWFQRHRTAGEIRQSVTQVNKLAKALAAVHDAGLIHGDIKPSHVLLTDDLEPMLLDAGVADLCRSAGFMDESSYCIVGVGEKLAVRSSRPYAAPEQNAGAATPASDVYALGVILHRMLTGKLPDSNPPAYHRPELDPVLDAIVKKAIAIDASHRFANGRELADALSAWLKRSAFR